VSIHSKETRGGYRADFGLFRSRTDSLARRKLIITFSHQYH
jgi:hypothetical protein